jgi:hypothetical protein
MERLLSGDKMSVEMIERFYARHLHGEMVVGKIHSSVV